jgi:hypothetical protein
LKGGDNTRASYVSELFTDKSRATFLDPMVSIEGSFDDVNFSGPSLSLKTRYHYSLGLRRQPPQPGSGPLPDFTTAKLAYTTEHYHEKPLEQLRVWLRQQGT